MKRKITDSHLVYIGTISHRAGELARYKVYSRRESVVLGWVIRENGGWRAVREGLVQGTRHRTRWEAATKMWPGEGER
jgi:hypothetical protein